MGSSSSYVSPWSYDVFLSFRGEDTRRSFVCHLYKELHRLGIKTFKDDRRLETGEFVSPQILRAIEESRFSIVVISKRFASSSWCLDELLKIVECMERGSQTVIPIFYEVDPSNVRAQTGSFAEDFKRHGEKLEGKLKLGKWKEAMTRVASIAGVDSRNWKDDSMVIEKVGRHILDKLNFTPSSDSDNLIGMDAHLNALDALICGECPEVRIIGICGMGGVGKTTIARCLFNQLSCRFQASCFIEDIKEASRNLGLKHLHERLLLQILQEEDINLIRSLGSNVICKRLGHKKILLVLDDVDKFEELFTLTKETNWFGHGSRIILTTRDEHLLTACGVKLVYKVKCLSIIDEALKLFCQFAFRQKHPLDGFQKLAIRATQSTGGLPLALRVLGSFLCGRSAKEWKIALSRLEITPPKDIVDVLRISYDGLEEQEKVLFLCLACFFSGEKLDRAMWLLDICDCFPEFGFKILAEKSLIDISQGYITMHDLLRQMGRELVRQQSVNEPGKRQFVWDPVEILYLLKKCTGTGAVEGIMLNMSGESGFVLSERAFKGMHNLKFLKFYNRSRERQGRVHLPGGLSCLPQKLRLLYWDAYPLKTLPVGFCPEFLVELDLRYSSLEKLWEGIQPLRNLKRMDLRWSMNLEEFPDLSEATNLEQLDLSFCQSLVEVPSSIRGLNKLTRFSLWGCRHLKYLPNNINLKSLDFLNLYDCSRLESFPEISQNIKRLYLEKTAIQEVPASIGILTGLVELHMSDCQRLRKLPNSIGNLTALQILNLSGCKLLGNFPYAIQRMKSLRVLNISGSPYINEFPHIAENITYICLHGTSIEEVPSWIVNLSRLQKLDISGGESIKSTSTYFSKLKIARKGGLSGLPNRESLGTKVCDTVSSSKGLALRGKIMKELPDETAKTVTSNRFYSGKASMVLMSPLAINLSSLTYLSLGRLQYCSDGIPVQCPALSNFPFLEVLALKNLNMPEVSSDLGNLCYLAKLDLSGNDFTDIPTSIKMLSRLKTLYLNNCKKLESLIEFPQSLKRLYAHDCESLKTFQAVEHSLQILMLINCFKLDEDSQRMASLPREKGNQSCACFPGSTVLKCFYHQSRGHQLSIPLHQTRFLSELVGFSACIVFVPESKNHTHDLSIGISYRLRDKCTGESFFNNSWNPGVGCENVDMISDHVFLFNFYTGVDHQSRIAFDEVAIEFYHKYPYPDSWWIRQTFTSLKITECGVNLLFSEDLGGDHNGGILNM